MRRSVQGAFDAPDDGIVITGRLIDLHGWVYPPAAVDRVEITVDDGAPHPARLSAEPRWDIRDHFADPAGLLSGWWHLLDLGDRAEGDTVAVHADAIRSGRRVHLGTKRIRLGPVTPPDGPEQRWARALADRDETARRPVPHGPDLRLLVVTHSLTLGGAQRWLHEVLRRVLDEPSTTCVVVAPAYGPYVEQLEDLGATVHLTGPYPSSAATYESRVRELAQLATDRCCNVVLANTLGCTIAVDAASRAGLPAVLAVHEHFLLDEHCFAIHGREVDPHIRARTQHALDVASTVVFVCDATREHLHAGPDERFVTIGSGIDLEAVDRERQRHDRDALRSRLGCARGDDVLLCVATVEPRKSQAMLVLALARLARDHPRAQLVLVGADDTPYSTALADLAAGLGLGARVRLVAATADVGPWYAAADAFVLASDIESLPLSVMEAMAFDLPSVVADTGGVADLVDDGVTGILCPSRDLAALTSALRRLLELPAGRRRAMGAAAATRARGLDADRYAASVGRLLHDLVDA